MISLQARSSWQDSRTLEGIVRQRIISESGALYGSLPSQEHSTHQIAAKSLDLNPIEKMWGWARKKLRKRGLADLTARHRILGKIAYRQRLRCLLNSAAAQHVASKFF